MKNRLLRGSLTTVAVIAIVLSPSWAAEPSAGSAKIQEKGILADPNFFPLAVWLQSPANAAKYRAAGINVYVGLYRGPTEEQLAQLKESGMRVICSQNDRARQHLDDPTIIGWMHGDEPDNAQAIRGQKRYGPPILPEKIVEGYQRIKAADPSRPVLLNMGQGVAWDNYIGRGVRRNHPEDYPEYVKGCDIASFDIYPACHDNKEVAGKLWFVPEGVSRLRKWAGDERLVWNCIECTHISNEAAKATPQQVKAEVWMSFIRGSRGIIYFVHEFKPKFVEAGLLADPEMLASVTATNKQIQQLAPVLNSPTMPDAVVIESSPADAPVEAMVKRQGSDVYLFAVGMRGAATKASFSVAGLPASATAEVLGEERKIAVQGGKFSDEFRPWDVHLYRVRL